MKILKTLFFASIILSLAALANDETSGSGTVAEKLEVEHYVIFRLEEDERWLASSPVDIAVGDRVDYAGGALMKDFYSRTLDRTFDYILFVSSLQRAADPHAGLSGVAASPHGSDPHAGQPLPPGVVEPPTAGEIARLDGGMTVEEILGAGKSLEGKQTALRARVMKVTTGILDRNWVTLQDGTGAAPNDHLIATSAELVEAGETVTVSGIIRNEVDIGSGYRYEVLLEDASFTK